MSVGARAVMLHPLASRGRGEPVRLGVTGGSIAPKRRRRSRPSSCRNEGGARRATEIARALMAEGGFGERRLVDLAPIG